MDGSRWQDGFEVWKRLRLWLDRDADRPSSQPADGGAALEALSDIGILRRLLDQAELTAVRAARGDAKTWAEIATRLGVTRQSAWERWRDLDDEPTRKQARGQTAGHGPDEVTEDWAIDLVEAARRGSLCVVPDVMGLEWEPARRVIASARLIAMSVDPDSGSLADLQASGRRVIDQKPVAGELRRAGSPISLWFEPGPGSGGVREPLHPRPSPRSTGGAVDEQTGESVP